MKNIIVLFFCAICALYVAVTTVNVKKERNILSQSSEIVLSQVTDQIESAKNGVLLMDQRIQELEHENSILRHDLDLSIEKIKDLTPEENFNVLSQNYPQTGDLAFPVNENQVQAINIDNEILEYTGLSLDNCLEREKELKNEISSLMLDMDNIYTLNSYAQTNVQNLNEDLYSQKKRI